MPLLQKSKIKRNPHYFSWNFHIVFGKKIAKSYQIFKSVSSKKQAIVVYKCSLLQSWAGPAICKAKS